MERPKRNTTLRNKHRRILKHTKPNCALCGNPIDYELPFHNPKAFVIDHIIPLAKGGDDSIRNVQPAHRECNRNKSDKPFPTIIKRSGTLKRPPKMQ